MHQQGGICCDKLHFQKVFSFIVSICFVNLILGWVAKVGSTPTLLLGIMQRQRSTHIFAFGACHNLVFM